MTLRELERELDRMENLLCGSSCSLEFREQFFVWAARLVALVATEEEERHSAEAVALRRLMTINPN